jgi:hypothetical protein
MLPGPRRLVEFHVGSIEKNNFSMLFCAPSMLPQVERLFKPPRMEIQISLDREQAVYTNKDEVCGHVILRNDSQVDINSITIRMLGSATSRLDAGRVTETHQVSLSDTSRECMLILETAFQDEYPAISSKGIRELLQLPPCDCLTRATCFPVLVQREFFSLCEWVILTRCSSPTHQNATRLVLHMEQIVSKQEVGRLTICFGDSRRRQATRPLQKKSSTFSKPQSSRTALCAGHTRL